MNQSITLGTLTLSMVVTVPHLSGRSRTKHVTLARYYSVSSDVARELKARFCLSNDELIPDFICGKWEFKEYI